MSRSERSTGGKCCMAVLITVLVISFLVAAVIAIGFTLTPAKLKIEDKEIQGTTFAELGLADTKFVDILKDYLAMRNVKPASVVVNGYESETESQKATTDLQASSISSGGSIDYYSLFTDEVHYYGNNGKVIVYQDTTLAYILNQTIASMAQMPMGGDDYRAILKDTSIGIEEVTIEKINDTTGSITIVGRALSSAITANLDAKMRELIPENIYVTVKAEFSVGTIGSTQGKIVDTTVKSIAVNGKTAEESPVANALLSIVADRAADGNIDKLSQAFVDGATGVINHLGKIASATADSNGYAISPIYGMSGVEDHQITVITQ